MAYIKALSYYLPERVLTNEELLREFPEWSVDKVAAKVGVKSRHIIGANESTSDMAEKAARKLFEEYNIKSEDIDFVILCTQSADYFLPSTACVLQDRLGIPKNSGAFDIDLGCSGFIYGLAVAKGLVAAGIAKNILFVSATTYKDYIHPLDKSSRSIFGDGAAACLISVEGFAEIGEFVLGTDGGGAEKIIMRNGAGFHREKTGVECVDDDGHVRRDDYFYMEGSAVFNFTLDVVPPMIQDILDRNMMTREDIGYYVFHQANKFMLNTIRKVCVLPKDKFYVNLSETGNTMSTSCMIALKDCMTDGLVAKDMNVMITGFGVGLSWGGTILKF